MGVRRGVSLLVLMCLVALGTSVAAAGDPAVPTSRVTPGWLVHAKTSPAATPPPPCGTALTTIPTAPFHGAGSDVEGDVVFGIDGTGPDDVWGVGELEDEFGHSRDGIEHWDGSAWTEMPMDAVYPTGAPTRSAAHGRGAFSIDPLTDVVAVTPTEAFAVGGDTYDQLLAWNGTAWTTVRTHVHFPGLTGVDASGPDDAWAVGTAANRRTGHEYALAEHWDGSSWDAVDVPTPSGHGGTFTDVLDLAPNDVWITGWLRSEAFVDRWNGASWTLTRLPQQSASDRPAAIAGTGEHDIWVTGGSGRGTLVERFDGHSWSVVQPAPRMGRAGSVAVLSSSDVWTAADPIEGYGTQHWDGTGWSPLFEGGTDVAAVPGGVVWVAAQWETARLCEADATPDGFSQSTATTTPGAFALWRLPKSNSGPVRIADDSGLGLFDPRSRPPGASLAAGPFPAAGAYRVVASPGGAEMTIDIPPAVTPATGHVQTAFRVSVVPYRLPQGMVADVQSMSPGGSWTGFASGIGGSAAFFTPDAGPGEYLVRARLRDADNGAASDWSSATPIAVDQPPPMPCTGRLRQVPEEEPANDALESVAAAGANDAWTVGTGSFVGPQSAVAQRFSGAWSTVQNAPGFELSAVDEPAPGIAWAAGDGRLFDYRDRAWHRVPVVGLTGPWRIGRLADDGPGDVWGVGMFDQYGPHQHPIVIHFDGTAWSSVDVPLPDGEVQLSGIAARAPDDVWLFGYWSPKSLEPERAHVLALHWNGSTWRRLGLGSPVGSIRGWANDATVAPGGAIWLVGTAMTPVPHRDPIEHPMALELRRGAWTRHDPDPADSPFFSAVAFSSPNDGWTVGQIGYSQAVMEHWDGASWSIVPLRIDPDSSFEDVAAAPDGSVFAVGQLLTYFDDYGDAVYASVIFRRC